MRIPQRPWAAAAPAIIAAVAVFAIAWLVLPGRAFAIVDDGDGPATFRVSLANAAADGAPDVVEVAQAPESVPAAPVAPVATPAALAPPALTDGRLGGCPAIIANALGRAGCPAIIANALGRAGCMISFCESSWNPNTTGAQGERGYFQIHPAYHPDSTYDPAGNVAAAVRISNGGTNWNAWSVRSVLQTGVCPGGPVYPG